MAKNKDRMNRTKKLALCALLSALGVVVIYIGSFFGVLDMTMGVIASLFCVYAVIEFGGSAPWLVYAVTAILSVVLLPQNSAAWLYLGFFGFYPILKEKFEKKKKVLSWIFKEVLFNIALALLLISEKLLLAAETNEPPIMYVAFVLLAELAFPLYDIALTRLITLYIYKLRSKFRLK